LQCLHAAQAGRRRQRDGVREIDVGDPAVPLRPRHDGTIHPVRNMLRHETEPTARTAQQHCVSCPWWRHFCHRVPGQIGHGEPMPLPVKTPPGPPRPLPTARGASLSTGALPGPGLLLLPGLAAAQAGPASIVAWLALLLLSGLFAAVFSALGRHNPSAGGVIGYVTAGLGRRAGRATGWLFLAGGGGGAPLVRLTGAGDLTGPPRGRPPARAP